MQSLLSIPSPHEDSWAVNLADWVELRSVFNADRMTSREDLNRALRRDGDLSDAHGMTSDFAIEEKVTKVFKELKNRETSCGLTSSGRHKYPFLLSGDQSTLSVRNVKLSPDQFIYLFLLAVSKADMSSARSKLPHDPTKLFEELCRDVLQAFWGGSRPKSGAILFGTARRARNKGSKFKQNIEDLCAELQEGSGWRSDAIAPGGGDGNLDLVAFRRFEDSRQGGLVGFGQCKTGIHWDEHLTELDPITFSRTYMIRQLVLPPLRVYMVPHRISEHKWESYTGHAGLLLDRCRIVEYSHGVTKELARNCRTWLDKAIDDERAKSKKARR